MAWPVRPGIAVFCYTNTNGINIVAGWNAPLTQPSPPRGEEKGEGLDRNESKFARINTNAVNIVTL